MPKSLEIATMVAMGLFDDVMLIFLALATTQD
jgi:hypothetical protein